MPTKPETIGHRHLNLSFTRRIRRVIEVAPWVGCLKIDRRRNDLVSQCQQCKNEFHTSASTQQVTELAFRT